MGKGGNWTTMRKKSITISEWVTQAIKESKKVFVDDHFDIFKCYENPRGLSLLKYACDVLHEAHSITSSTVSEEKSFNAFVYIPFRYSRKLICWDDSNWMKLGEKNKEMTYEPPSLCLLAKPKSYFANLNIEEYRCPIELPSDFLMDRPRKISALFCCFRDQLYGDEFYSRIYVYYEGEF